MPALTQEEQEDLLTVNGMHQVFVGTIDPDGAPRVIPCAYLYRDRQLLFTPRERSRWRENIERDPRVAAVVTSPSYPWPKITIRGRAELLFEPGRDDEWRDTYRDILLRNGRNPKGKLVGGYTNEAYVDAYIKMTWDEPRALLSLPFDRCRVTSWRMPIEGETLKEVWAPGYYQGAPPAPSV